jgi:hypothetical protein
MTNTSQPQAVLVPRRVTGAIAAQLRLPVNAIGAPLLSNDPDLAGIGAWWQGLDPVDQHAIRDAVAILAAPHLLADIRASYQQKSQIRTAALAGGAGDDAPWIFFAPVREEKDYQVQPVADRAVIVDSFMAYIQAGAPVWDSGIRFHVPVPEFAALLGLTDVHTYFQYDALLRHEPYPETIPLVDLVAGVERIAACGDQRYLFPSIAHLLPPEARALEKASLPALIEKLGGRGLLRRDGEKIGWTDGGLFFADSLHRRVCALALDIAGATASGALATQGALFIRGDQVLWYCDIEPDAAGNVAVVSISVEKAREILDEILTPVGAPPAASASSRVSPATTPRAAQEGRAPSAAAPAPPALQPAPTTATPKPAPAFCAKCGAPLVPGARFCAKCGAVVG